MPNQHPIYDANLSELDIAVFDLETTGLYSASDSIIQIAAIKVHGVDEGEEWMTLVNPGDEHRLISNFIQDFTGIKDADLDEAPALSAMMQTFKEFVGTRIVAGHNVKGFDLKFIRRAESRTDIEVQSDYYIDTLSLMRKLHPELDGKKLVQCGIYYEIEFDENSLHDALADTQLCVSVLAKQIEELSERGVSTFSDMIDFLA